LNVVGLDLAGSPKRDTGFALLHRNLCVTSILHTDEEILSETRMAAPDVVSIDAPLFLPKGRASLEQRGPPHLRACDKELLRMKIRFFPISLGPMRMLTERGMRLRKTLEEEGFKVIEGYPGAVQDILGMPRKQAGLEKLRAALADFGIRGGLKKKDISGDELDAITCAILGKMYLDGSYQAIGVEEEGFMILPDVSKLRSH
jgi:predicted nuclease with RNAse H fold